MSAFTRIPDIPPDDTPIFRDLAREWAAGLGPSGGAPHWRDDRAPIDDRRARLDPPTRPLRPAGGPMDDDPTHGYVEARELGTPIEPLAATAGEQDHSDPWIFAGEDAPAPESTETDRTAEDPR